MTRAVRTVTRNRPPEMPGIGRTGTGWQERAACKGTDEAMWFPQTGHVNPGREARAKAFCAACPVVDACLEHALTVPERYGIWGGMNEKERQNMRRRRSYARRVEAS